MDPGLRRDDKVERGRDDKMGRAIFTFALAILFCAPAFASVDGQLGARSEGSVHIMVRKSPVAGITALNDMAIASADFAKGAAWSSDVCVYSATGGYHVAAVGSAAMGGDFVMSDGDETLAYNVAWNDGGAGHLSDRGIALKPGVVSGGFHKAITGATVCREGATARLVITVPPATVLAGNEGFSESLTLLVSPD